jgi:hypothetical protein
LVDGKGVKILHIPVWTPRDSPGTRGGSDLQTTPKHPTLLPPPLESGIPKIHRVAGTPMTSPAIFVGVGCRLSLSLVWGHPRTHHPTHEPIQRSWFHSAQTAHAAHAAHAAHSAHSAHPTNSSYHRPPNATVTMGGVMSSLFPLFDRLVSGKREYRILMLGLDAAGKSMICIVSVHERGR